MCMFNVRVSVYCTQNCLFRKIKTKKNPGNFMWIGWSFFCYSSAKPLVLCIIYCHVDAACASILRFTSWLILVPWKNVYRRCAIKQFFSAYKCKNNFKNVWYDTYAHTFNCPCPPLRSSLPRRRHIFRVFHSHRQKGYTTCRWNWIRMCFSMRVCV